MHISEVIEDFIFFDNGNKIEYNYYPTCYEENYADFKQLEDAAYSYDFDENLLFERCDYGFRFGDKKRMFFIPCYSVQNGYYSNDIDLFYKNNDGNVIATLDTDCDILLKQR